MSGKIPLNESCLNPVCAEDFTDQFPVTAIAKVPGNSFLLFFLYANLDDLGAPDDQFGESECDPEVHVRWFSTKDGCNKWLRSQDCRDIIILAGMQMKGSVYEIETHQIVTRYRLKEWA